MVCHVLALALGLNMAITDEQARKLAQSYAQGLGIAVKIDANTHLRRDRNRFVLHPGEILMTLDQDGKFLSLNDMGAKARLPQQGKPKYKSEGEAWAALELRVKKLGMPEGLQRSEIKRDAVKTTFTMNPKPYGYQASGGNKVYAEFHSVTGKVISLNIGRGWTYEKPNVVVKPADAVKTAMKVYGGKASEWKHTLAYDTSPKPEAPFAIRNLNTKKIMRLCYNMASKYGSVTVDSVTGEVVAKGSPLSPQTATMRRPG
ncbi:MAG TPA: hypothetical protein PKA27_08320 [Fimbriimonadaceae bacterium]|nr:hypothetical protein [Fimbriimonadaceae bacterium]